MQDAPAKKAFFSDRFFKFLSLTVPHVVSTGACTHTWNPITRKFVKPTKPNGDPQRNYLMHLNFLILFFWLSFQIFQLLTFYKAISSGGKPGFGILFTIFCSFFVAGISYTLSIGFGDSLFLLINTGLLFLSKIHQNYLPNYNPNTSQSLKLIEYLGAIICIFMVITGLMNIAFYIRFPFTPNIPGSYFLSQESPWYYHIGFHIFHNYQTFVNYLNLAVSVGPIYFYGVLIMPLFVNEFRLGKPSYKTSDNLRQAGNLVKMYRAMQLLQINLINELLGRFLVPMQSVATILFVFSSFMLIRHGKTLDTLSCCLMGSWAFLATTFWGGVLLIGGILHSKGLKTLGSWKKYQWKNRMERKVMGKFGKSCKPVMISFGKAYVIRKATFLIFIRGLTRGLMRVLLTTS